ncbi:MAG TPA: hypothetical protein VG125_12635 [Pirellulales bacterium]|jgi:hypothetical protein|nr:hypothetical protein [Pirellulales bacterium]
MSSTTRLPKALFARIAATGAPAIVWLLAGASFATAQSVIGPNAPREINVVTVPAPPYFAALTLYQAGQFREAAATLSTLVKPLQ